MLDRIIRLSEEELRMIINVLEYRAGQKRDFIRENRLELSKIEISNQLEKSREYENLAHELEEAKRDE